MRRAGTLRKAIHSGSALTVLTLLAGLAFPWPVGAQDGGLPFSTGERLLYEVRWRGLPAGHAEIVVDVDGTAGHWTVNANAKSVGYVSNIYPVDDEYESQFETPGFCSSGIHKHIQEAERRREVKLEFDSEDRVARLEDRDLLNGAPPRVQQVEIPSCVQDILSAMYYARSLPMTVGQSFEFPLNDGAKTIQIRADVQAEEEVATEAGVFQTVRVEPDVFSGRLFSGQGRLFLWFSKDERRIPVQLRAQIGVGTINATLAEIEPGTE
jgi:hypothetical protein